MATRSPLPTSPREPAHALTRHPERKCGKYSILLTIREQGGAWNYGASAIGDMGGIAAEGPSAFAAHDVGAFGVTDTAYSGEATYTSNGTGVMNTVIKVDPGTAASTAGHGIPGSTKVLMDNE